MKRGGKFFFSFLLEEQKGVGGGDWRFIPFLVPAAMLQYSPASLLRKWQRCLDEFDGIVDTLLMDLSKACKCVNHELVIAK